MTEKKGIEWQELGKEFASNVMKGIALGFGFAVAGAAAGYVASKTAKSNQEGMSTTEAGARGGRARQAA
jgi:hypothetical protein